MNGYARRRGQYEESIVCCGIARLHQCARTMD